jgi:allantoinase
MHNQFKVKDISKNNHVKLPFEYWPIIKRQGLKYQNDERIAVWFGLNIESYDVDKPATSIFGGTSMLSPDPLNYGWRDYSVRVGIWRMIELFDKYKIKPSCLINSDVCINYPDIINAGNKRNWPWIVHGKTNSVLHTNMDRDNERKYLEHIIQTITAHTGIKPNGWLGPALTETYSTPAILSKLGLNYILDWCNDDQPYPLKKEMGKMISVPYSIEINDIPIFIGRGMTGEEFYDILKDQFDVLYQEGINHKRVMAIGLHPFIIGQAFRIKYLEKFISYIKSKNNVWITTSDEIASWYMNNYYDEEIRKISQFTSPDNKL